MAEPVKPLKAPASPGKSGQWKLIAGLVGVLVALICFGGGSEETADPTAASSQSTAAATSSDGQATSVPQREIPWPVVPLEFLLANNPFQPASRTEPAVGETELTAEDTESRVVETESLPTNDASVENPGDAVNAQVRVNPLVGKKVRMVFHSSRGSAAMIDDKVYYEGDLIENYEITAIARNGVTLRLVEDTDSLSGDSGTIR